MILQMLMLLIILTYCFKSKESYDTSPLLEQRSTITEPDHTAGEPDSLSLSPNRLKAMLYSEAHQLKIEVINKILIILKCAKTHDIEHNNILTIIDYSQPSSKKRLWVFDLAKNKLLFHTYVSHGIKSGTLLSSYFSNKVNSKASSIGVYNTEKAYYGRHGLSLKLYGLEENFNDNAYQRFIVMHGSWYVNEGFIKKYGRAGRSWGCPVVPMNFTTPIIETIKDDSLLVIYYPGDKWLLNSKYLNCNEFINKKANISNGVAKQITKQKEFRKDIIFVDINKNNKYEKDEPIVVITAENYKKIFNSKVPLNRMLRRQINNTEYIALTAAEFASCCENNKKYYFVIPVVKKLRGFYATEMKILNLGKVKNVKINAIMSNKKVYTVYFENKPSIHLKSTKKFIRWLGL